MSIANPDFLQVCPLCRGRVLAFRAPRDHTMTTCTECGLSFVIPVTAWAVERSKRGDTVEPTNPVMFLPAPAPRTILGH